MKKLFILHSLFLLIHSIAFAGVSDDGRSSKIDVPDDWWDEEHAMVLRFACIGSDGAPILNEALASICCKDGLLVGSDDQCKASIVTNFGDPITMAHNGMVLANQALTTVKNMLGLSTDFNRDAKLSPNVAAAGVGAAAVADLNQSKGAVGSGADHSGAQKFNHGISNRNGNSRFSNQSVGAGGSSLGTSGATSGLKVASVDLDKGSYASGKGSGSGSGGLGGSGSGSGSASASSDALQDYQLGEASGGASSDTDTDSESVGSAEDPKDYFSRTRSSDSLFRIVSSRYMKKKSFWKSSEKVREDTKQKKI